VGIGALVALALSACQPIVWDFGGTLKQSTAQYRVAAITTGGKPGIDIRIRDCSHATITFDEADPPHAPITVKLRPTANVVDASGHVFFHNETAYSAYQAPGSRVVDTDDDGGVDRIIVPVVGAKGKLTIRVGCTSWQGWGSGGGFFWAFPSCTTSSRSCPTVIGGTPSFVPPYP
jgi:hypothetical protein